MQSRRPFLLHNADMRNFHRLSILALVCAPLLGLVQAAQTGARQSV
jgi:hypothetical protein